MLMLVDSKKVLNNCATSDTYNLPPSITGKKANPAQRSLTYAAGAEEPPPAPFGICINQTLFQQVFVGYRSAV